MKKTILATVLLGLGCGGGGGTDPVPTDCSEFVVLSEEEISINSGVLPAESCWLVESDFRLGRELTVKEGVVIELAQGVKFVVQKEGSLTVEGTEEKPVLFTGTEEVPGFWHGIEVESDKAANSLDHAIIEYGGSKKFTGADFTKTVLYVDDAQLHITNSKIRKNNGSAFVFVGETTLTLENNEVSENEIAAWFEANLVGQISDSNTWTDNADPSVNIGTGGAPSNNPVSADQTWLDVGTSLKLVQGMAVKSDVVISPNLTILMAQETAILVDDDGSFNLVGTAETPISLIGSDASQGFWKGIFFKSKNSANVFDHVSIQHSGGSQWNGALDSAGAIYMDKESKLVLTNSEIAMSGGFALIARESGDISGFAGNLIKDNAETLNLQAAQMSSLNGDSIYENNAEPYISVARGTIDTEALWKKQTTPFRLIEKVDVSSDLLIEPGVILEFGENGSINVETDGSMNAEGTASDKIIFTGADKIAGFWKGLAFRSASSQNILKHVEVSFAGSDTWGVADTEANIYLREARVDISDSKIGDGAGFAIHVSGDSELASCTNVDFSGNAKGEISDVNGNLTSACP